MRYLGIDLHLNRFTVEKLALGKTIETVRNTYGFDGKSFGRFKESLARMTAYWLKKPSMLSIFVIRSPTR